jgi:hypothetical protein
LPTITAPCQHALLSAVDAAAKARGMSVAQLIRACLTVIGPDNLASMPDPGTPESVDESYRLVPLKRGGFRRQKTVPRLRIGYPTPVDAATVRKAAWVAATVSNGEGARLVTAGELNAIELELGRCRLRLEQMTAALETLAFRPLRQPISKTWEATYVLGFTHEWGLDPQTVNSRFRTLAPIFHPDTGLLSSAERMSQLLEARNFLLQYLRQ